ncbi:hypothetical protein PPSIR1_33054 [Plesiocystis pacifica SIR-1]|uniref:Uncharacterized protein n=1 Tax=Plesiocystis pacifica SIR-1 TaxID=391625 RepID=A6GJ42_9BACT|nr:hypothetical protein [Plesiocystis pacifica]EDM74117.1 hypothetical protein PPSIR1_33054 [Plesiocystis pacifica SIR-1]
MEVGSPEWIESSLARLEELERQQGEHEAALETATDPAELQKHTAELQRLDEELKGLYAQLEAVAGEDEDEADAPSETMGDDEISRPVEVAPPVAAAAPLAEPVAAAAESPFGAAPAAAADSPFDTSPPLPVGDDDLKVGNSSKWVFIALVLVAGVGVSGWFAYQNMVANQPAPEPEKGPTKRIEASAIPDDTEEPNAVQGGDATVSPTAGGGTKAGSGGGGKKKKKTEKKKKKLEIGGSGDPLG